MSAAIQALLALIEALLPKLLSGADSALIQTILNALVQVVPVIIQEATDLIPYIKNIIASLSANSATTTEQLATLQALDKQADDAFEAAAAAQGFPAPSGSAA